jgi:hypothetical protein
MIFNQEAKRRNSIDQIEVMNSLIDCLCKEKAAQIKPEEKRLTESIIVATHAKLARETNTLARLTRGHMKMGIM